MRIQPEQVEGARPERSGWLAVSALLAIAESKDTGFQREPYFSLSTRRWFRANIVFWMGGAGKISASAPTTPRKFASQGCSMSISTTKAET